MMVYIYHTLKHTGIFPLLLLIVMLINVGCQKERSEPEPLPYPFNKLPLPTQTGENTFGCLINGEPWVAYAPWNIFGGSVAAYYDEAHYGFDNNQRLIVQGNYMIISHDLNSDSISSALGFTINPVLGEGHYDKHNLENYKSSYFSVKPGPTKIYALDTLAPFHIHITKLDTVKKIVSGTFEMDLIEIDDPMDVLHIRHGRFDAWYQEE